MISGYTCTETVQDNTSVGTLESASGSIAQLGNSADGYDLNVTNIFAFTGGTLNNTSNTGIVHLKNLTSGYIYGGTTTGSTLNIESGTTLRYGSGDITFSNSAFIHSLAGSITLPINANDPVGNFIKLNAAPPPDLIEGKFTLTKNDYGAMLVVAGGELIITKTVGISGHVDNNNPTSASLGMNGGKITITNGVGVHVQFGFAMSGGSLNTVIDPALANNQTVYIVGTMSMTGGTIELGSATASSSLQVTENVFFTGVRSKPRCSVTSAVWSEISGRRSRSSLSRRWPTSRRPSSTLSRLMRSAGHGCWCSQKEALQTPPSSRQLRCRCSGVSTTTARR